MSSLHMNDSIADDEEVLTANLFATHSTPSSRVRQYPDMNGDSDYLATQRVVHRSTSSSSSTSPSSEYHTFRFPSITVWGAWMFRAIVVLRLITLVIFVQGLLMQQRDISSEWNRDQFAWIILASGLIEIPLYFVMSKLTTHQPTGRRILLARLQGQILVHMFTFVAFYRTDTAHFVRSESGYCGTLLILLIDVMLDLEIQQIFDTGDM